jgi:hypothetical protein
VRFQSSALLALQEAAEDVRPLNHAIIRYEPDSQYIVTMFEDTNRAAQHAHRDTMCGAPTQFLGSLTILFLSQARDMALVLRVRGDIV